MPRYVVGDKPHIWGLTAFMLQGVLNDILLPGMLEERVVMDHLQHSNSSQL